MRSSAPLALLLALAGCGGSTGSALVTFSAVASGPSDAAGGPLEFTNGAGADVTLTRARLHVGAVYLNQTVPLSGASEEPCVLPGIYVGEAYGPLDVDLLSPNAQPFPAPGEGTQTAAHTGEVWLTGGDVNTVQDGAVILDAAGTAVQDGASYPFVASVTIGANHKLAVTNPAMPGASPICHRRIVSPILVELTPTQGGTLSLGIDPRPMFRRVDFSRLAAPADGQPYVIPDDGGPVGGALYDGILSNAGVYRLTWSNATTP